MTISSPAIELLKNKGRKEIILFLVEEYNSYGSRKWYNKGEIAERDISINTVRRELTQNEKSIFLFQTGVIESKGENKNITHYRLQQTKPSSLLIEHPHKIKQVANIFQNITRRKIVNWLFEEYDFEITFTQYKLYNELGISYEASKKQLPKLVEENILITSNGTRTTEYKLNESAIVKFLIELDKEIINHMSVPPLKNK